MAFLHLCVFALKLLKLFQRLRTGAIQQARPRLGDCESGTVSSMNASRRDISCSDCEAVCCRLTVQLMPGDAVPAWLTTHDAWGLQIMAKDEDGWCEAVDRNTMRCTIYAQRPQICRKFAMGGPYCRAERAAWRSHHAIGIPVVLR